MSRRPMTLNPVRLIATAVLVTMASACVDFPVSQPDAPLFDMQMKDGQERIVTRLPRITLTGTAEYGAKLELTRKPAFATGETPKEQSAHPYTAGFAFEGVPLREGVNLFALVAVDWSGRRSAPAELVVEYVPRAGGLKLSLSSPEIVAGPGAGRGQLKVTAAFDVQPEEAVEFADRELIFSLSGAATRTRTSRTDDRGIAEVEFTALDFAGAGTVTATDGDLSASAQFVVLPGPAAKLEISLESEAQPGSGGGAKSGSGSGSGTSAIAVGAGATVDVVTRLTDASGNDVTAPVSLYTDAAGAFIEGSTIGNLRVPGVYRVVAAVNGALTEGSAGVSAEARLEIAPGAPARVVIQAPDVAVAGSPFAFTATVVDAFDNPRQGETEALVVASDDPEVSFDTAQGRATLRRAGARTLTATLPESELHAEHPVAVAPGPAAELAVALDSTFAIAGEEPFTVMAHETASIEVTTTVTDAYGNAVDGPVLLQTSYGLGFVGTTLPALVLAGAYDIDVSIPNTALSRTIPFAIAPAAPFTVALDVAKAAAAAGEEVVFSATVRDRFGNVTEDSVSVSVDGAGDAAIVLPESLRIEAASETPWTIRASAGDTGLDDVTSQILISPASPAAVFLSLGGPLSVSAGDEPEIAATVEDAYGNAIADPPLEFLVVPLAGTIAAPPGPYVSDGRVRHLVRAGQYRCVARIPGTTLTSDPDSPDHVLTVVPGAPASVEVVASDASTLVGFPVELAVVVRDIHENIIEDAPAATLSLLRDGVVIDTLADPVWTPAEPGAFKVRVELDVEGVVYSDEVAIDVAAVPDGEAPVLTLVAPAGHRTVTTWPPAGDELEAGCEGALLSVSVDDASDLATVWLSYGGVADLPVEVLEPAAGTTSLSLDRELCSSALTSTTRGEVLVEASAVDEHGHFAEASGSWCIDPDAADYLPAGSADRCAVARTETAFDGVRAIAANRSGRQLVVATTEAGAAALKLVSRFPYVGSGAAHLLTGHSSPGAVALTGMTVFTTTLTSTGSAVARTTDLTNVGAGATDTLIHAESETDRFHGVLVGADGALYTTWGARTGVSGGSSIHRFAAPMAGTSIAFDPADPPFAASESLMLTHLCQGVANAGILAAGRNEVGRPALVRVSEGNVQTLWTASSGALVRGCAVDGDEVVLSLEVTSAPAVARTVRVLLSGDPPVEQDVFTGFEAGTTPEWVVGPAVHEGRFFVVAEDGPGAGALLRMTN